jgi:hypothetical protein
MCITIYRTFLSFQSRQRIILSHPIKIPDCELFLSCFGMEVTPFVDANDMVGWEKLP